MSEKKPKISEESAKAQFVSFLDYYFLSFEDIVKADGKKAAQTMQNLFVRAIIGERLEFNRDDGLKVSLHLKDSDIGESTKTVVFDGSKIAVAKIAMGKLTEEDQTEERQNAFMGCLCGLPGTVFMKLIGGDITIYGRLAAVFSLV